MTAASHVTTDAAATLTGTDPNMGLAHHLIDGGTFILDAPDTVPAIWGDNGDVLWAQGESLIIAGPPGVGKTTLTGQVVRGLLGLQDHVLGYSIAPASARVLYLAMDRPQQIARSLRRHFTADERQILADRLLVWRGPPPADLARMPDMLTRLALTAGASHVIIDSLKDAALGLTDDEVGAGYNRARQTAIAAGVEVLELHHVVKRGANGARPNTLSDLYGSTWLAAGAGSVLLLWGAAGDPIVDLTHLKSPAEIVGPLRVVHDHTRGHSDIWHATDPLAIVQLAGTTGITANALACALFETDKPDRNQTEKARRKLDKLVTDGAAEKADTDAPDTRGGPSRATYRARTRARTDLFAGEALTTHARTHADDKPAGHARTRARTARTDPSTHDPTPPFRGGGTCAACGEPLDPALADAGTHPGCAA